MRTTNGRYGNSLLAVAATIFLSACGGGFDGFDFFDSGGQSSGEVRTAVAHAGGRFVSAGEIGIRVSNDGASFTTADNNGSLVGLFGKSVTFGPAGWLVLSDTGIFTSPGGMSWTTRERPTDVVYSAAAAGAGLYVLVGPSGAITVSPDAESWTRVESPTTEDLLGVAFVEERFVAVGSRGTALLSTDGSSWSLLAPPTASHLTGVAGGNGILLLTGTDGTILRSESADLSTWAPIHSGTRAHLTAATFGGDQFVVVGSGGAVLTSSDGGLTFTPAVVDFGNGRSDVDLKGVAYGDDVFVAVGAESVVSPDGLAWAPTLLVAELPRERE
jgi:photosystem II stability/assembly factor-like uncharacterized protein